MAFEEKGLLDQMFDRKNSIENVVTGLLAKEANERVAIIEQLMPTKEEVYKFLDRVPKEKQADALYKFQKFLLQGENLRDVNQRYSQVELKIQKLAEYMPYGYKQEAVQHFIRSYPAYQGKINKPEDLGKLYTELIKAAKGYSKMLKRATKEFVYTTREIEKVVQHYGHAKPSSHAENLVAIGISVGFASLVLYALSQISPENVTIGAFFAGSNSSVLLTMLSAVVIFLLFFLTHHKLK